MKITLKKLILFPIICCFSIVINSCKKESPGPTEVFMEDNKFNPSSVTVLAGATITWKNKDNSTHTVSGNNNEFESGDMGQNKSFSFTFSSKGTFSYYCKYHTGMIGKVIVQ